mmetsp:Transcript_31651/g.57603  ORF Transcript_31651/g.57603 Transcript_31651/m.57603 type:complete len:186 (+) Transcript_31651:35-592(+)
MGAMGYASEDVEMEIYTAGAQDAAMRQAPPFVFESGLGSGLLTEDNDGPFLDPLHGEALDEEPPVDFQDIWAGAACGVPVHERSRIAPECVAGVRQPSQKTYTALLKSLHRVDGKLLRDRLSHLAEGEYDVATDVVRPRAGRTVAERPAAPMAVDDAEDVGSLFRRREGAEQAKANRRRRSEDDE